MEECLPILILCALQLAKLGRFVLPPSSFVSIYCMAKALSKSPTMGVMLAPNTEIWHLVTSRPYYWVHGQRLYEFGFLPLPMGNGLYSMI